MTTFRNSNHHITPKRTYKNATWDYQHTMGYKRQTTYLKGKKYFTKDFEKKEWANKYLRVVKDNAKYPFYYNIKENEKGTFTLNLFRATYWEE